MNFLAHFRLSCNRETLIVGNFLADFLRKAEQRALPADYQEGLSLHYAIDHFTDHHPVIRSTVRLLHPRHSKYASVILDVLLDYFLAKHWLAYHEQPLPEFRQAMYRVLEHHLPIMPQRLQRQVPRMIEQDWLREYTDTAGLSRTFARMQHRVSKPAFFQGISTSLTEHYAELDRTFTTFFPDILDHVAPYCRS